MTQAKSKSLDCLVGKWFHTMDTCEKHGREIARWQGRTIAALPNDYLLMETFEWLTGGRYSQEPISFTTVLKMQPIFHEDKEEMSFSYHHDRLRHSGRCED
jgi:hypothetical protein